MNETMRIWAEVNLDAIEHNIEVMRNVHQAKQPMMAVIKTNGYGHGAIAIANMLEQNDGICGYAVATAEEAFQLRKAGIKKMILILGYVFEKDYEELIRQEIRICVFREDMAQKISQVAVSIGKDAYIHIKIDSGMGRIGFVPGEESLNAITRISKLKGLHLEGIFTHFARADEKDKQFAKIQFAKFSSFIKELEKNQVTFKIRHCANSAAILKLPEYYMDMMRAGITLYGLMPSEEVGAEYPLEPALSLYSSIVHIKEINPGDCISYGGTYCAKEARKVATVPVGYGDGYPRALSNQGYVLIRGQKAPILGRVCMDQMMVDVTDIDGVSLLDQVVLIGRDGDLNITMEELGEISGRFNYELACDLGNRIPRFYYRNGKKIGKLDYFA